MAWQVSITLGNTSKVDMLQPKYTHVFQMNYRSLFCEVSQTSISLVFIYLFEEHVDTFQNIMSC